MASDYGTRTTVKINALRRRMAWVGVAASVAAVAAVARDWSIAGAPCPTASSPAALPAWPRATKVFEYDGVHMARAVGHVSCNEVAYDAGRSLGVFPVCQFSSPAVLIVTTRKAVTYYLPGPGQRATVSVPHGTPRCVLSAPAWPTLGR
jgi:hypothetical protein